MIFLSKKLFNAIKDFIEDHLKMHNTVIIIDIQKANNKIQIKYIF